MPASDPPDSRIRWIEDDEYICQYGYRSGDIPEFPVKLRPRDTDESLSAILGRVSPAYARSLVRKKGVPTGDDGVRYARVGALREMGFKVTLTPTTVNTLHVSVSYPNEWDDPVANMFNACFSEPQWYEDSKIIVRGGSGE